MAGLFLDEIEAERTRARKERPHVRFSSNLGRVSMLGILKEKVRQERFLWKVKKARFAHPFNSREVAKAFYNLARRIGSRLVDYDLIVGDDTSGRLPAIIMHRVAKKACASNGIEQPKLVFHPGRQIAESSSERFFDPSYPDARALIVTEGIAGGYHVHTIASALAGKRSRSMIDVASVGMFGYRKTESPLGTGQLFVGTPDTHYRKKSVSYIFHGRIGREQTGVEVVEIPSEADEYIVEVVRQANSSGDLISQNRQDAHQFAEILGAFFVATGKFQQLPAIQSIAKEQ